MRGRSRVVLTAIGVLLACLLMYFFFIKPQRTELANVRAEIEAENAVTIQLNAELTRLRALQANQAELEADLALFRQFVPLRPDLANFIFRVQDAANAAGLDFVEVAPELPEPPPEGAALAQVRSQVAAAGGYFALQDFLRRLYNLDRALRVDNFSLSVVSTDAAGVRLRMNMSVRMFYELPDPTAVTSTDPVPAATPTPTTTP